MKNLLTIAKLRRSIIVPSVFALSCFGILSGDFGPSRLQSPSVSEIKVVNKTQSLQVMSLDKTADGHLHLILKNISSKDVNGYEVSAGGQARITTDTSSGDWVMSPGATHELEFPAGSAPSELTILAAMFADGSIEGDPATVIELRQWRAALKRQLNRALPLLEAILDSPDVNTPTALDRLESQLSSLSLESDTVQSRAASGSRGARDNLITNIQFLRERLQRSGPLRQRQRLLDLKERVERRIASL